ncbi:magnesium/cobalt transporter CorA [Brevibacillus ginsengisoli]|uniref:magnesium/cobalt transporter CorA n=1 Tax=Brevibacillus ginsengisoli TaxID=363854 RepID=UPI003CE87B24
MIQILAMTIDGEIINGLSISDVPHEKFNWYWVDLDRPTDDEIKLLSEKFSFHKLAVEDCQHHVTRPKVDFYGKYNFFVLHSLKGDNLEPEEVDMFLSTEFIVTFHKEKNETITRAMNKLVDRHNTTTSTMYIAYLIIDSMVDDLFPPLLKIEDRLGEIENMSVKNASSHIIDAVYDIRSDILKMRRVVNPMRDLLYRIVNSERLELNDEKKLHFMVVYDHLLKLSEKLADDRDTSADILENVNSILNQKTNELTLKTNDTVLLLTVISIIFMPLTFIVGVYGMNFEYIPELHWKYGYFIAWGVMILLVIIMIGIFKKKGLLK